jgi:hypothetical protein
MNSSDESLIYAQTSSQYQYLFKSDSPDRVKPISDLHFMTAGLELYTEGDRCWEVSFADRQAVSRAPRGNGDACTT